MESELQSLKSSTTTTDSETARLQSRITSLESSQRDTLALLEKKTSACDDLATELSNKQQKIIEIRREVSTLEQQLSSSNASLASNKLREQEFEQEAGALKRHNEWLDQELKTKSSEHSKFRKEKSARISELQQQNEDGAATIEGLQRTEKSLRARLQECSERVEEYSTQMHALREEHSRDMENFKTEIETANRLAELLKESLDTERQRHQDLSLQLDEVKQSAADEIGRINAEVEKEHEEREGAERRVVELEVQFERLEADFRLLSGNNESTTTPKSHRNMGGAGTPRRDSPVNAMSPPSASGRAGINYTQLITDYHVAKNDLDNEKRRNEKLSSIIDDMIRDMELRQPEITEMQNDNKRLEADILEMSTLIETMGKERDQSKKDGRKWERQVAGLTREGDVLRQQLRDLSSQIKVLMMEVNAQQEGSATFTREERLKLEALAAGDYDSEMAGDVTDTDRFISQQLTTFHNIAELQEQNQKLLRVTRELGDKMEGEEARSAKAQASQNQEELGELRQRFERSKEEIKILMTQSQSYIKERDMFRRMLSHRGQLPAGGDHSSMFGESVNGFQVPATPTQNGTSIDSTQSPASKDMAEFTKALKELQSQYDDYRKEAATHRSMLREQTETLSKQNSELRTEVSKKTSEATLAVDRYEMLNGNYTMLKSENEELKKRAQSASERFSKQEIRTQQAAEDLVEAKGLLESLRNENANLKAEKDFWKTVERRLIEEKANLVADRDKLNALNANLQKLSNEREQAENETRRRLQSQIETLEGDMQTTQKKLAEEVEEAKRAALRREYDNQQSGARIEGLLTSLGSIREELVSAKTARDHLQARADELTVELRSAKERLTVLQPSTASQSRDNQSGERITGEDNISREQELSVEVSELKRDLEFTQKELADTKSLIEQYRAISQTSEEELLSLNETQDQYRIETDRALEEKNQRIRELEETIETLRSEISNTSAELVAAQTNNADHSRQIEELKSRHKAETAHLNDAIERAQTTAQYHQEDLKKQAEIAQQAQQNYDNELVKHAEAAQNAQKYRSELNELKLENAELRTSSEAAHARITQNEESWGESRERYERELVDIKNRKDDLAAQNRTLHDQLEKINNQIAELRKNRASDAGGRNGSRANSEAPSEADNLQELIKYLRQEKDIIEAQFLRSSQESKRLRQQLDHAQHELDEARLKLVQEQRSKDNSERQALNHNKLMETLGELNLYRESNSTLRLEKSQIQSALNDKTRVVEDLQNQVQPLQAKVGELEDAKEMQEAELRMAQEAKDRFEKRYLDVLNRSNAVDPADYESAQQKIVDLETERAQLVEARTALQEQVDEFAEKLKHELDQANERFQESRTKLVEQSKQKARDQNAKIREKDATLQEASQEKQALNTQLASLTDDLERAVAAKDEAVAALAQRPLPPDSAAAGPNNDQSVVDVVEIENLNEQLKTANANVESERARVLAIQEKLSNAESLISELQREIVSFVSWLSGFVTHLSQANSQESLAQANARIADLEAQQVKSSTATSQQSTSGVDSDQAEDEGHSALCAELNRLREEADDLQAKLSSFEHAEQVQEGSISVADQISAQVEDIRKELTARHESRVKQAEEKYNTRAQSMKEALNKRLTTSRAEMQQKLEAVNAEAIESIKQQHNAEIEALNQRHAAEIAELQRHSMSPGPKGRKRSIHAADGSSQSGPYEFTEAEVRDMLQNNPLARKLVMNSLGNRERKVREEEQQKIREQLADVESKIAKAKKDAEGMVEAKFAVKFNLTENKMKAAQAKFEYVQNASQETPDKAVKDVWQVAKDVKPAAPAPKSISTEQPQPTRIATPAPASNSQVIESKAATQESPAPSSSAQPDPFATGDKPNPFAGAATQPQGIDAGQASAASGVGSTTAQNQAQAPSQRATRVPSLQQSSFAPQSAAAQAPAGNASGGRGQQSGLPVSSAGRGGLQSRGGGQRGRGGSNIARPGGRGGGTGRGNIQAVNTVLAENSQAAGRGQNSPRGNKALNANAQQFVPGQKRGRDESGLGASEHASDEKRFKGNEQ